MSRERLGEFQVGPGPEKAGKNTNVLKTWDNIAFIQLQYKTGHNTHSGQSHKKAKSNDILKGILWFLSFHSLLYLTWVYDKTYYKRGIFMC